MMRAALVRQSDGLVVNVVVVGDPSWTAPEGHFLIEGDEGGIGDAYADGLFISPASDPAPAPVPPSISRRQLLLGLLGAGFITTQEALDAARTGAVPTAVQTVFNALPAGQKTAAEITWASMLTADRNHPLVVALAAANNLTDQQVDDFFRTCAAIA